MYFKKCENGISVISYYKKARLIRTGLLDYIQFLKLPKKWVSEMSFEVLWSICWRHMEVEV